VDKAAMKATMEIARARLAACLANQNASPFE
jgi:hypothetical protein